MPDEAEEIDQFTEGKYFTDLYGMSGFYAISLYPHFFGI
jgi:hypothetical protein